MSTNAATRAPRGAQSPRTTPAEGAAPEVPLGRRTREDTLKQPYSDPRQRKDTRAWVFSYTDPVTGQYRKNQPLLDSNGMRPRTAEEAKAAAAARWKEMEAEAEQTRHGITLYRDFHPLGLVKGFVAHQQSRSSRPKEEKQRIDRAMKDLARTRFRNCTNLSLVHGEFAVGITNDLLAEASMLKSTRRFGDPEDWVRTRLLVLRRMILWANENLGMPVIAGGISPCLRHFAVPRRDWEFFYPLEEAAAVERALKRGTVVPFDPFFAMTMWLLLYTGARRSEVLCVRVRDVMPEPTDRHPNGAIRMWNSKLGRVKSRRRIPLMRKSPLFPKLRKAIQLFVAAMALGPNDFLCLSPARVKELRSSGVDLEDLRAVHHAVAASRHSSLYRYIKKLCAAAGVPYRKGCHVWRHTYVATRGRMVHAGGNPVTLSDLQGEIGHILNSETTRDVYEKAAQHPLPDRFDVLDWRQMAHIAFRKQRDMMKRPRRVRANLPAIR